MSPPSLSMNWAMCFPGGIENPELLKEVYGPPNSIE